MSGPEIEKRANEAKAMIEKVYFETIWVSCVAHVALDKYEKLMNLMYVGWHDWFWKQFDKRGPDEFEQILGEGVHKLRGAVEKHLGLEETKEDES